MSEQRRLASRALSELGIENLTFGIHDACFPGLPEEDPGRGTPYSQGACSLLELVSELGFNAVQLGPQGETSEHNPSPYDGAAFSKTSLDVSLFALLAEGLISRQALERITASRPEGKPDRVAHSYAWGAVSSALDEAFARFGVPSALRQYRERHAEWLEPDALYLPLAEENRAYHFQNWPNPIDRRLWNPAPEEAPAAERRRRELRERYSQRIDRHAFVQLLLARQHEELRRRCAGLGLRLFGDLPIGLSARDLWRNRGLFLPGYLMGAPPSRTNPEGQDWGYPVLAPDQHLGPGRRFLGARAGKLLDELDGLRIDHPHGLVCPWVYRAGQADPLRAVQHGARLLESPDLAEHPSLGRFAIARPDQLDRSQPRYGDGWVRWLSEEQVGRYATLFDAIVTEAQARGLRAQDLVCEVLSTLPLPLGEVLKRHRLGRFRVTQKANLDDPSDVYRSENARPEDWIMVGNHDTRPIWRLAKEWQREGQARRQAEHLVGLLIPQPEERARWVERFADDPRLLAQGKLAELFTSRARNVFVFFSDLFGLEEVYNLPGTVSPSNWTLRLESDFARRYREKRAGGKALDLPWALAMALRARRHADQPLIQQLAASAGSWAKE